MTVLFQFNGFDTHTIETGWTIYTKGDKTFEKPGTFIRFEVRYMKDNIFISGMRVARSRGYSSPEIMFRKSLSVVADDLVASVKKLFVETVKIES